MILNDFFKFSIYSYMYKLNNSQLLPHPTPIGIMFWSNMNIHYLRIVQHKDKIFWPSDF